MTLAGAVQLAATPFAAPQIHVTGSDPTSPFVFPFALKNSSEMLPLGKVEWTCKIVHMEVMGGTFDNDKFRTEGTERSVEAGGVSNHACNVMNAGVPVRKVILDVRVDYTTLYLWPRKPVTKRFTWVAAGDHSAWIEGDVN